MTEKISHKVDVVVKGLDGFAEELREIAGELEAKAAPAVLFDEREEFEKWVTKNGEWPNNTLRSCLDPDRYANFDIQGLWAAWQARAAMVQGVK